MNYEKSTLSIVLTNTSFEYFSKRMMLTEGKLEEFKKNKVDKTLLLDEFKINNLDEYFTDNLKNGIDAFYYTDKIEKLRNKPSTKERKEEFNKIKSEYQFKSFNIHRFIKDIETILFKIKLGIIERMIYILKNKVDIYIDIEGNDFVFVNDAFDTSEKHTIQFFQFFNDNTLSSLLSEDENNIVYQFLDSINKNYPKLQYLFVKHHFTSEVKQPDVFKKHIILRYNTLSTLNYFYLFNKLNVHVVNEINCYFNFLYESLSDAISNNDTDKLELLSNCYNDYISPLDIMFAHKNGGILNKLGYCGGNFYGDVVPSKYIIDSNVEGIPDINVQIKGTPETIFDAFIECNIIDNESSILNDNDSTIDLNTNSNLIEEVLNNGTNEETNNDTNEEINLDLNDTLIRYNIISDLLELYKLKTSDREFKLLENHLNSINLNMQDFKLFIEGKSYDYLNIEKFKKSLN